MIKVSPVNPQKLFSIINTYLSTNENFHDYDKSLKTMQKIISEYCHKTEFHAYGARTCMAIDFIKTNNQYLVEKKLLTWDKKSKMLLWAVDLNEVLAEIKLEFHPDQEDMIPISLIEFDKELNKRLINNMHCINTDPL